MKKILLILCLCFICQIGWGSDFPEKIKEEMKIYNDDYWRGWRAGRRWAFDVAIDAGWKPKSIVEGKTRLDEGKGKNIDEIYYEVRYLESNNKGEVEEIILKNASISKFKVTKVGSKQIFNEKADIKIKIYK